MDDLAGVLVLLGLAVLAVPVLLVVALVAISGLKRRVGELERQVVQLRSAPGTQFSHANIGFTLADQGARFFG